MFKPVTFLKPKIPGPQKLVIQSGLLTSLISYYKMDEASGTRVDSVVASANDLTDNNTVTSAAGKISNAGQFTRANSEYLSHADNASLSTGDIDFTWAAWVYMDSKPAQTLYIIDKEGAASTDVEYMLRWTDYLDRFDFFTGGSSYINVTANTLGAPSLSTWYLIIVWHDSVANTINIQVNNGTVDSVGTGGVAPPDTTNPVYIGARTNGGPSNFWDGRIDEVGFWKRVLTATERTNLYNGGAGVTYPFTGVP